MFYVSEQEPFSPGGITPPVLLNRDDSGKDGCECNHDYGADVRFSNRMLWCALLENDERE